MKIGKNGDMLVNDYGANPPTTTGAAIGEAATVSFAGSAVVQLIADGDDVSLPIVAEVHGATVKVTARAIEANDGESDWSWSFAEMDRIVHGGDEPWSIIVVPGVDDFGVSVPAARAAEFRQLIARRQPALRQLTIASVVPAAAVPPAVPPLLHPPLLPLPSLIAAAASPAPAPSYSPASELWEPMSTSVGLPTVESAVVWPPVVQSPTTTVTDTEVAGAPSELVANEISAWFGTHQVLDRVSLAMPAGKVTALIGPSGCGKIGRAHV